MSDYLLTVTEAAEAMGLAVSTVRLAVSEGRLPAQKVGARWVIRKSDLANYKPVWGRSRKKKVEEEAVRVYTPEEIAQFLEDDKLG